MIDGFLLGVVALAFLAVGVFFLRFWKNTRDALFLFFAASFLIEGLNRCSFLFLDKPNEGTPWIYIVRVLSYGLILAGIVHKNRGAG